MADGPEHQETTDLHAERDELQPAAHVRSQAAGPGEPRHLAGPAAELGHHLAATRRTS